MRLTDIEVGKHYELRHGGGGIGPRVQVVRVGEYKSLPDRYSYMGTVKKGVLIHPAQGRDEWVAPQRIASEWTEAQDEALVARKAHKERIRQIIASLNEALGLLGGDGPDWLAGDPYRKVISAYNGSINRHNGERINVHGSLTLEQAEALRDRLLTLGEKENQS